MKLEPEKKSKGCVTFLAAIGVAALAIIGLFIVVIFATSNTPSYATTSRSTHRVKYVVATDHPVLCRDIDVTYEMAHGTAQKSVTLCDGPTSQIVDEFVGSSGDFVYLAAQNGKYYAEISCKIYIDSQLVYHTTSEGQYVIASCSGSIP